jgi:hypothetical protein
MLTGILGCVCNSKLNIGIFIFAVQNFALWKENFEFVWRMEKMNEINKVENALVKSPSKKYNLHE